MIGLLGWLLIAASPEWTALVAVEGAMVTIENMQSAAAPRAQSTPPVSSVPQNSANIVSAPRASSSAYQVQPGSLCPVPPPQGATTTTPRVRIESLPPRRGCLPSQSPACPPAPRLVIPPRQGVLFAPASNNVCAVQTPVSVVWSAAPVGVGTSYCAAPTYQAVVCAPRRRRTTWRPRR